MRPEGWEKLLTKHLNLLTERKAGSIIPEFDIDYAEAGADAYEEGLKKGAIHIRTKRGWEYLKDSYEGWFHGDEVGYIVFIKEEKR